MLEKLCKQGWRKMAGFSATNFLAFVSIHICYLLSFLFVSVCPFSALKAQISYTWNGSISSAWNLNTNWTPNTGFPGATDHVVINSGAPNQPLLDVSRSIQNYTMNGGTFDLNGLALTINGNVVVNAGTINNGSISVTAAATTTLGSTSGSPVIGAGVSIVSSSVTVRNTSFNSTVSILKNGASNNIWVGNNTYNGATSIQISGTGYIQLSGTTRDIFNADLTLTNTGTGVLYMAHNHATPTQFNGNIVLNSTNSGGIRFCQGTGTCVLAATKTIAIGGSGFSSSGSLYLRNFTQTGITPQNLTLTGTSRLYLQAGTTFNGPVLFSAPQLFLNGTTFNKTANLTKSGATTNSGAGGNTFNDTLILTNNGTGILQTNGTGNDVFNGNVFLNNTNTGGIRFGQSTGTCVLAASRTISIGTGGYTSSGPLYIRNFTQTGATPQTLSLAGTAQLYLQTGNTFNGDVTITAAQIFLNGTKFMGTASFTKTGAGDNAGLGGNTFNQDVTFTNSGAGYLQTNGAGNDTFNGNITVNSTGAGGIRFGQGNGLCILEATKTISIGVGGFSSSGGLYLRRFIQNGALPLTLNLTGTSRLHLETGTRFLGDVNFSAPQLYLNGARYFGLAVLQKTGATANAGIGGNIFYQNVTLSNSGTGYLRLNGAGNDTFYENLTINNTSSGGIQFGQNNGICWLASGKTISIGGSGYTSSGALYLRNFKQQGALPQSLNLLGTAPLYLQTGSVFNSDVDFRAAQMFLNGARFKGITILEKKGAGNNTSIGGNVFDSSVTIRNLSTGTFRLCNNAADTFYGNALFIQTGSGALQPCYTFNSAFYRNISTAGTGTAITFGANTGVALIQGNRNQFLDGSVTRIPVIRRLNMLTDSNLILNVPLTISINLKLDSGKIVSTHTHLLTLTSAATTTVGNAQSYVVGPMVRTQAALGPLALHFPIGNDTQWLPAVLTATHASTTSVTYRAVVVNSSPALLGYTNPFTISNISTVRYWQFDRQNVANFTAGSIQLYYFPDDSVSDPSNLRIVKNNNPADTLWYDIGGNGSTTPSGTITSSGSPTVFNSFPSTSSNLFTYGNLVGGSNGLPVELIGLDAVCHDENVALNWTTASETNNRHFRIWYSNGDRFNLIDSVPGTGNSQQIVHYRYVHEPIPSKTHYYRIEQVDFDGKNEFFGPVFAECSSQEASWTVYPNPVHEILNIQIKDANARFELLDVTGKSLLFQTLTLENNRIEVSHLASGCYYARISNDRRTEIRKIYVE